jgi:single-strand DNA-binding protein
MNKVILMGRLTKDPDVKYSQAAEPIAIARYSLAVDRMKTKNNQDPGADFISCVAFGKNGEFAEKYLRKGMKILIEGRIQTGSYDNKEGKKVYTTDVVAERQEFCEKREGSAPAADIPPAATDSDGFMNIPDDIQEELPFN